MSIKTDLNVRLENSDYMKKNILEGALFSNVLQQSVLNIKELQALKKRRLGELKKTVTEISELGKSLHFKEFPQFGERKKEVKVAKKEINKEKEIAPVRSTEESALVKELNEIKSKLDSLNI